MLLAYVAFASGARASCIEHPLTALGPRLARLGEPAPLLLLAGAVAAPLVLAPSGVDQRIRVLAQRDLGGRYDAERMSVTAPYALAAALAVGYGVALVEADCAATAVTARSLQAMGLAFLVMAASKIIVGRTYPAGDPYAANRLVDDARSTRVQPFEMAGAWPSGHAATTFAFAAVIRTALPARAGALRYGGYLLATAVSVGMLLGDHHWASDVVSGALLGEAIGRSVGAPAGAARPSVELVPAGLGVALVGRL
jgi:membrane-associated phospholipid phosphatase